MAGLNKKKVFLNIVFFTILSYLIFLYPFFQNVESLKFADILFLNFSQFEQYGLSKFNSQFLILFVIMFFIIYHEQISIINENTSFLSMELHKRSKNRILMNLFIESAKDNILIFIMSLTSVLFVSSMFGFINDSQINIDLNQLFKIIIYLIKFDFCVYKMVVIVRILNIIKISNYYVMIPYFILILYVMIDFVFGTSIITISDSVIIEIQYLVLMILINLIIDIIIYLKIYNGKELYND